MASPPIAAGHRLVWEVVIINAIKGPKFIHENGNRCPTEPTDGFLQYAHQTKYNVFDFMRTMPSLLKDFNNYMGHTMGAKQYWLDWFPVEERLLQDLDATAALLVDIGGGKGHDIQAFHEKYTNHGRLILQDLPHGLDSIKPGSLDPTVEVMVHDFFTEQPIQGMTFPPQLFNVLMMMSGARTYFLHHILHDWSDGYCLDILKHIRAAMKPKYSKLLIHELILPDTGANAYQTIFDMTMMSFSSGMERSRTQWRRLLERAGFEVVGFWVQNEDADGVVEAIIAE